VARSRLPHAGRQRGREPGSRPCRFCRASWRVAQRPKPERDRSRNHPRRRPRKPVPKARAHDLQGPR
jgi:hypothetical protein